MKANRFICFTILLSFCLMSANVVYAQEEEEEGTLPLKRGPRKGFEREEEEEFEDDFTDEEEEEEEEEAPPRPPGESLGTINFSTPDLDDEDHHSPHLPSSLKCDACHILTHMMTERLDKANEKRPSLKKKLPESEIIDIFEELCSDEFHNVGVKEINGKKRLSGPGSKIQDTPGIMQGGGKWPFRMLQMCQSYLGDYEEEELYGFYLKGKLDKRLCYGPDGVCTKKKDEGKKKGKGKDKKMKKKKSEL
nr:marginal zone B- and B1-cell-specific protein-like [Lytechinus pictus]